MPQITWRAGIDLAPVDVMDHEACAWLETLIWPGQPVAQNVCKTPSPSLGATHRGSSVATSLRRFPT